MDTTTRTAQHMEALGKANEVRHWLAEQKREVKAGGRFDLWSELCLSRDGRLKSVTVLEFLTWLPGVGKSRARAIIADQFNWPTARSEVRSVSRLDHETAARLCAAVPERARGHVRPLHRVTA